jgi:hypothetical protein
MLSYLSHENIRYNFVMIIIFIFCKSLGQAELIYYAAKAAYTKRTLKRGLQAIVPKIFYSKPTGIFAKISISVPSVPSVDKKVEPIMIMILDLGTLGPWDLGTKKTNP